MEVNEREGGGVLEPLQSEKSGSGSKGGSIGVAQTANQPMRREPMGATRTPCRPREHFVVGAGNMLCLPRRSGKTVRDASVRFVLSPTFVILTAITMLIPNPLGCHKNVNWGGIKTAAADPCGGNQHFQQLTVLQSDDYNLTTIFDCEDGNFDVTWSGSVTISDTIRIGNRTKVSIYGDYDNGPFLGGDDDTSGSSVASGEAEIIAGSPFGSMFSLYDAMLYLENMTLRDGNVTESTATFSTPLFYGGGGIFANNSEVTVVGCKFEDMYSEHWGGAIYANFSRVEIHDTIFRRCRAGETAQAGQTEEDPDGAGGAVAMDLGSLLLNSSEIEDCYASNKGGGVQFSRGDMTISNSVFQNNSAGSDNVKDEDEFGEGGDLSTNTCTHAFGDEGGNCTVSDSFFESSRVGKKGGVMQLSRGSALIGYQIEVNNCTIVDAIAGEYIEDDAQGEGGVFSVSADVTLILRGANITGASAGKKGGVIVMSSPSDDYDGSVGGSAILIESTFQSCYTWEAGGVVYLNSKASVFVMGSLNRFEDSSVDDAGAVIYGDEDSEIVIKGGNFTDNYADEEGGVIRSGGTVTISDGIFSKNEADSIGGVILITDPGTLLIDGGVFKDNQANEGGVVFVDRNSHAVITGGVYSVNEADNGGVFFVDEDATFAVEGGNFIDNSADFGGFLYKKGNGSANCSGTSITEHRALNGGAIFVLDDAELLWECDLNENEALTGPAIYARGATTIALRYMTLDNNVASRGSVIFLVDSELTTLQVEFTAPEDSEGLSAVQADEKSSYTAEATVFSEFAGEVVIYSRGKLTLDDCDFRLSSAEVLVDATDSTFIRNAVLSDNNYASAVEATSAADLDCGSKSASSVCGNDTVCMEGDLGVYCNCYTRAVSGKEMCVVTQTNKLNLQEKGLSGVTFYPDIIEVGFVLSLDANSDDVNASSSEGTWTVSSTDASIVRFRSDFGVIWNASASGGKSSINWTVFPSNGLLPPGESISLRLIGEVSDSFDGTDIINITVQTLGTSSSHDDGESSTTPPVVSEATAASGPSTQASSSSNWVPTFVTAVTNITFYHCESSSFWDGAECIPCQDAEEDVEKLEGLDCSSDGEVLSTLTVRRGYWRADSSTLVIRKCFREEACLGGRHPEEYCAAGYEGPYCAVCENNYGRGGGRSCHKCTTEFLIVMYFLLAMGLALTIIVWSLLAVYLVGGGAAFTSTVRNVISKAPAPLRVSPSTSPEEPLSTSAVRDPISRTACASEDLTSHKKIANAGEPVSPSLQIGLLARLRNASRVVACGPRRKVADSWGNSFARGVTDFSLPCNPSKSEGNTVNPDGEPRRKGSRGLHSGPQDHNWEIYNPSEEKSANTPQMVSFEENCHSSTRYYHHDGCGTRSGVGCISDSTRSNLDASRGVVAPETLPVTFIWDALVNRRASKPAIGQETRLLDDVDDRTTAVRSVDDEVTPTVRKRGHVRLKNSTTIKHAKWREDEGTASRIGDVLTKLPVTKIKIVVVVWQITSASTEITQASFPRFYREFLGVISIFTFDLEWLFSAACVTNGITFYTKLLIATLGPLIIFCLLTITFFIGSRGSVTTDKIHHLTSPGSVESLNECPSPPGRLPRDGDSPLERQEVEQAGCIKSSRVSWGFDASSTNERVAWAWDTNISMPTLPRDSLTQQRWKKNGSGADAMDSRHPLVLSQRSTRRMLTMGPGDGTDVQQSNLWRLFARHTTVMLVTLHLIYPAVSTVVLQTFPCLPMDEIGKEYLMADLTTECDTPKHKAFMVYSGIMIAIYPVGIPLSFWYLLYRQRSRLNPPVEKNDPRDLEDAPHVLEKKILERKTDESVSPTAFLWAAYLPHRYFFEVLECMRRLLLTAVLVFTRHLAAGQVAMSCILAFVSMLVFELLRPHADKLDAHLYRTGCLVIFFSNFLALMIEVKVTDTDSAGAEILGIFAVILNVLFFLSIWWNTYARIKAVISGKDVKDMIPGARDVGGEDETSHATTGVEAKERSRGPSVSH